MPLIDQQRLFAGAAGDRDVAVPAIFLDVFGRKPIALAEIVPVELVALAIGPHLGGATDPSLFAGALDEAAGIFGAGLTDVEGEDQLGRRAIELGRGAAQFGQRGFRIIVARHERDGSNLRALRQCDRVEDTLAQPDFGRDGEIGHRDLGHLPPLSAIAGAVGEIGLALAEAAGLIDQPFPIAATRQREAHRGRADAELLILIPFLRIGPPQALQIEAAGMEEIGISRGVRIGLGLDVALRPIVENVGVEFLDVAFPAAPIDAAAFQHPGLVRPGP